MAIRYLNTEDVLFIHRDTIAHEGGLDGLRDWGLLASAIAMPRHEFGGVEVHPTIGAKAAAYLYHLAQNHPFHDGNKRVATVAALAFLAINGAEADFEPQELENATMNVAASTWSKQQLITWFESQLG